MQSTFVHSEFHVWHATCLAVNDEHLVIAVVSYAILSDHVAQSENVGNRSATIPHMLVLSFHFCLLAHAHGTTVAFQSHAPASLGNIGYQCFVAN
jgi:hypothetical protein